ncbi:MAG: peptidylprolyl isomerase [Steroidobacteraceae bacterium]|jgi:hypothetical protein
MRFCCPACLLVAALACAQDAHAASPPAAAGASAVTVRPDDAVITLDGNCRDSTDPDGVCRTVITRAQFEQLVEALQPDMSPSLRLSVANAYARNVKMAAVAERRGLDKTPAFAREMEYARMQLLSQDLSRALHADADRITEAELANYYRENQSSFEQATVARIYVPHARQSDADAMTKVCADLRERALRGEDPDKLQMDAFAQAGTPQAETNTRLENVRRATLPPSHETVLDLKPGEISGVFSDPGGAHFIYKMISKETLAFEAIKAEIRSGIAAKRYRDSMRAFQSDIAFNDAYFNPPSGNPATVPPRHRRTNGQNGAVQDEAKD